MKRWIFYVTLIEINLSDLNKKIQRRDSLACSQDISGVPQKKFKICKEEQKYARFFLN